jgi:hypothetical protein
VNGTDFPAVTRLCIFRECLLLFTSKAFVSVFLIYKSKVKDTHTISHVVVYEVSHPVNYELSIKKNVLTSRGEWGSMKSFEKKYCMVK